MNDVLKAKELARKISKEKKIKLKDALAMIAKENKFDSWKSYKNFLDTFWYQKSSPFLNHWFSTHAEAQAFRQANGGYLLTYKGQYFVASEDYIEFLGLDSHDPIWEAIGFDVSSSNALEKFQNYYRSEEK